MQPEIQPAGSSNRLSPDPKPPVATPQNQSKQTPAVGTSPVASHETSNFVGRAPASAGNPANIQTSLRQPARSTRNPNPKYIDEVQIDGQRPWSASKQEIASINAMINFKSPPLIISWEESQELSSRESISYFNKRINNSVTYYVIMYFNANLM